MATVIDQISRFTDEHQPGFVDRNLKNAQGEPRVNAEHPWGLGPKSGTARFTVLLARWVLGHGPA